MDILVGKHGNIGFVVTNTIAEGDTRRAGLKFLVESGLLIYEASDTFLWPGLASVAVRRVHLAKGKTLEPISPEHRLGESTVPFINSLLRPGVERPDPQPIRNNSNFMFQGSNVLGTGFFLTLSERDALIQKNVHNDERIFPAIGGEEVNTNPDQSHNRYVINFGQMTLAEAAMWPDLMGIIQDRVKPERDRNKRGARKDNWWKFGEVAPSLYRAIVSLPRCLVNSQVTKHLVFCFQPTDRVFTHALYVSSLTVHSSFAVLQSRPHEVWARLLSSSLEDRLRYSATDCFETFPFPKPDPRTVIPELEDIGQRLYEARAKYMLDTQQGLTATYNQLKDPACHEPRIEELRRLHEEMDHAVLAAYGWSDVSVPPYGTPTTDAERKALEAFEDEVIDRLFVLNAERAEEERKAALSLDQKKGSGAGGTGAKPRRGRKPKGDGDGEEGQGQLF